MADDAFERACAKAQQRWPVVPFSRQAFREHWTVSGERHPEDLFLGKAGGCRVPQAWERIEIEFGPVVRRDFTFRAKADFSDVDEWWAETRDALHREETKLPPLPDGRPHARLIRYGGECPLAKYFVTVGVRLAIQRHRKRKPTTGLIDGSQSGDDDDRKPGWVDGRTFTPGEELLIREGIGGLSDAVDAARDALTPEQLYLLRMVHLQGQLQKAAGATLGWNESKTSRQLDKALAILDVKLAEFRDLPRTPDFIERWRQCLERILQPVQEPAAKASKGWESTTEGTENTGKCG